jgi:hypothetical protein
MFSNGKTAIEGLSGDAGPIEGFSRALGSAGEADPAGAAPSTWIE